tara:strand:- start:63 stop:851 length:789 start_codon:yes stop_codon:yes gene_type:complete
VTKNLTQRADELRLLGWSDEGASRYAAISEKSQLHLAYSQIEVLQAIALFFVISTVLVVIFVSLNSFNKSNPKILLEQESSALKLIDINLKDKYKNTILTNVFPQNNYNLSNLLGYAAVFFDDLFVQSDKLIINILVFLTIFVDLLLYIASLLNINAPRLNNKTANHIEISKNLKLKSERELRLLLQDVGLLSSLKKEKLIELIISTPYAMRRFNIQERKSLLNKKTNIQLRKILQGQDKISRLRKSELVDKIISIEFGRNP